MLLLSRSARTARIEMLNRELDALNAEPSRSARTARIEITTRRAKFSPSPMSRSARTARIEISRFGTLLVIITSRSARTARIEMVGCSLAADLNSVAVRKDRED